MALSCKQTIPPNHDSKDPNSDPILLERVYICTSHAKLCMLDKLYLHLVYAWNLIPKDLSTLCIAQVKALLSSMGFNGGSVQLKMDTNLSKTT